MNFLEGPLLFPQANARIFVFSVIKLKFNSLLFQYKIFKKIPPQNSLPIWEMGCHINSKWNFMPFKNRIGVQVIIHVAIIKGKYYEPLFSMVVIKNLSSASQGNDFIIVLT